MESDAAVNEDFNLSTAEGTTVLELAETIWRVVNGRPAVRHVVRSALRARRPARVPDVRKARDVLGFQATTTLEAMLDEVIPWIAAELRAGRI